MTNTATPPPTSAIETMINPHLAVERQKATFSIARMTNCLDGGVDRTARRHYLEQCIIENEPTDVFSNIDNCHLHRTERHVRAMQKTVRLLELCRELQIDSSIHHPTDFWTLVAAIADDPLPISLHWIMFIPNIMALCDDEQQSYWLPKCCHDYSVIGCYAQTELGHGSNVRGLETTATFCKSTRGFILHTPTVTATKFWPGTLGKTANHAMVIARLIDGDNVDRGIHNFIVPLRDSHSHALLPGVITGDIGPKIGYNNMDNGYCQFHHVWIPRRNMAMKFAIVDENGKYVAKNQQDNGAAEKVAYITMMQVRAMICRSAASSLAMACTISIRYSAVRHQGYMDDNSTTEIAVLNYTQQQYRLFPLLAASYGFYFTGQYLDAKLRTVQANLWNGTAHKLHITDVHATSSALKSYMTTYTALGMEEARKACGGHGYLASSGLPELYTTYLQNPTVEGDNHMLPQQVIKVLLKLVAAVQKGRGVEEYKACDSFALVPFLQRIMTKKEPSSSSSSSTNKEALSLESLLDAFAHRAARLLVSVATLLERKIRTDGLSQQEAWNYSLVEMARTSKAYSQFLILRIFIKDGVTTPHNLLHASEIAVLTDLARLLALYWIVEDCGDFMEDGFFITTPTSMDVVRTALMTSLAKIRPNAVPLVDAWDFSDFRLKSTLGRYDGNVYEAIMEAVKREPLNQCDPGPAYEPHLKRLIGFGGTATAAACQRSRL